MASCVGCVVGGDPVRVEDAYTVQDVYDSLGLQGNYQASVNGEPAQMSDAVSNEDYVSFSLQVKGGTNTYMVK